MGEYEGEDFYGCPRQKIEPASALWIEQYAHYDKGILWTGGGLSEQPLRYVRAMALIRDAVTKFERETAAENERVARLRTHNTVRRG